MPAYLIRHSTVRPRERLRALVAAVLLQLALAALLLRGLEVDLNHPADAVQRLIAVTLSPPPPPPRLRAPPKKLTKAAPAAAAASRASPRTGGAPGPEPSAAPPSIAPVVAVRPLAAPSGGGAGTGFGSGAGSGSGAGGHGGAGGGGTDLEQIAGEITPRDYPRHLGNAGIGGRVGISFTVGVNGRVTSCRVTSSSGIPELDLLTCRLIQQRFVYRPSTDRFGRPIADQVDGEHVWDAGRN